VNDKTLFPLPLQELSDKQQIVMDLLQANPTGLRSGELGALLHQAESVPCSCSPVSQCKWAHSDGERIGKQLRALEPAQAIKRKSGHWQSTVPVPASERDTGTLPEGF